MRHTLSVYYDNASTEALLFQDVKIWVKDGKEFQTVKGLNTGPIPQNRSIVVNKTMNLLYVYFIKMNPSKEGKENILDIVVSITNNQIIITSASPIRHVVANHKVTVDDAYYVYMHLHLYISTHSLTCTQNKYNNRISTHSIIGI